MQIKQAGASPINEAVAAVRSWLEQYATAVRQVDYGRARGLFADDVVSFGPISERVKGLADVESRQWRSDWSMSRGFDFEYGSLICEVSGETAWASVLWTSQSLNHKGWRQRSGRCTFVFERRDGRWLAVHSHTSLTPVAA